ncbi:universal stress protein [Luteococcus peritonei]|uniref:Universal stress protein n=1 Tax=Luteococcus peritonei TaxID=88874 RepID=A0ABW4RU64_9ACTN
MLAWIEPGTWQAVVEAARRRPAEDELRLVAAVDAEEALPSSMMGGLMGRGRRREEHQQVGERLTEQAATELLARAADALGRDCRTEVLSGRVERVVTAACDQADLLLLARDGDRSRLGPASLGRHTRFVLDHAPCTVALLWPGETPSLDSIPAPPPPGHRPPPPPHER